jgi:aryl-alcohol dehydrogenase-like predicted oxidoreductase
VIATKFGHDRAPRFGHKAGGAPDTVRESLENSLRDLRTDYIDLFYLHRPDPHTPIADTLGALLDAQKAGKVLEIGCSEFSAEQLREADKASTEIHFAVVQNEYSLLNRKADAEIIPLCAEQGMALIPWFPLMSGLLTGKYRKGQPAPADSRLGRGSDFSYVYTERNVDMAEELIAFSEARGRTVLELAVSWLLARPEIASVIAGATRPEQVGANAAAGSWALTPEELAEVDRITLR